MAVITKLVKGFDPDYPFKQQRIGDYFDVKGEPPGRLVPLQDRPPSLWTNILME